MDPSKFCEEFDGNCNVCPNISACDPPFLDLAAGFRAARGINLATIALPDYPVPIRSSIRGTVR